MADQIKSFDPATGNSKLLNRALVEGFLRASGVIDVASDSGEKDGYIPGLSDDNWRKANLVRITPGIAGLVIKGFKSYIGSADFVREKVIFNEDFVRTITLRNEADSVSNDYRIQTPRRTNYLIRPYEACRIFYDSTVNRWIVLSPNSQPYHWPSTHDGTFATFPTTNDDLENWVRAEHVRFSPSAADLTIRGFATSKLVGSSPILPQYIKILTNFNAVYKVYINHNDAGAGASSQKIYTDTGKTIILGPYESAILYRLQTNGYWGCSKFEPRLTEQNLADAATITFDAEDGINANVTITANRIFNFTNTKEGQRGIIRIIQDGVGSHTITWQRETVAGDVHYPGGTPPTLTTAGNAVDVLEWYDDGSAIHLRTYSLDSKASGA